MAQKFKIKKGDKVVVITGRDKGKTGEVLSVERTDDRVRVAGVNMIKRHTRPSNRSQGGIIEKEAAIHISNVALVAPGTDAEPTKVGYKVLEDGRKVRFARANGETIDA